MMMMEGSMLQYAVIAYSALSSYPILTTAGKITCGFCGVGGRKSIKT